VQAHQLTKQLTTLALPLQVCVRCGGAGRITVNGLPHDEHFRDVSHRLAMLQPLLLIPSSAHTFDVELQVEGPGSSSQVSGGTVCVGPRVGGGGMGDFTPSLVLLSLWLSSYCYCYCY
jgi:hypothetical protein